MTVQENNNSQRLNADALNSTANRIQRFAALLTNGSEQCWLEKECINEQAFRDYINETHTYYICLYCENMGIIEI